MDKHGATPTDLADVTLVAYAEEHGHGRIFSIYANFHIYRICDPAGLVCEVNGCQSAHLPKSARE